MSSYIYQPSAWGLEYHGTEEEEVLGAGSAGPGKSLVLLHDADQQIMVEHARCEDRLHPFHQAWGRSTGRALHLRRTLGMLEETLVRAHIHFREMDQGVRWDLTSHTFIFSSGYRYKFGHCKDTASWTQYLSQQYSWIGFDELVQFNEEQYDHINTRCRSSDKVLRPMKKVRSMSNPLVQRDGGEAFTVKDPNWVRRRFVEPYPSGRMVLKHKLVEPRTGEFLGWNRLLYLPATLDDNPDPEFVRDYKMKLVGAPAHIRDAMLYGNWFLTQNSYYGADWNPQVHICNPFKIPDWWRCFRSMDWGYRTPGVIHWWALDDEDTLFCIKEFTFKGLMDIEVAERVREIERDLGFWDERAKKSRITGPADTQLWEKRGDSAKSKILVFLERGVPWVPADKNKRSAAAGGGGRAHNAQLLSKRLRDYDVRRGKPPGIVFFSTCKEIIKTIPTIIAEDGDPETPVDWGDDHWFDSACYAVAYASHGPRGVANRRMARRIFDDDDERFAKRKVGSRRRSYDGQF